MKPNKEPLPPALKDALASLTLLSRKIFSLKFGSFLLLSLSLSWLALFVSDRVWDTPDWARIALTCSGWAAALAFAWMIHLLAFRRSDSIKWLAWQVRHRFGGPGDRFLGVIELARKRDQAEPSYSASLYAAALKRVETEISRLPLEDTFDRAATNRAAFGAVAAALMVLGCFLSFPGLAGNASLRWALPWAGPERQTLTTFTSVPSQFFVARGEPSVLRLALATDSQSTPPSISLSGPGGLALQARENGKVYEFLIPGQQKAKPLALKAGDYRAAIDLVPMDRPLVTECEGLVSYPAYLKLPDFTSGPMVRSLDFPLGSKVLLRGSADRSITMMTAATPDRSHPAEIDGNSFVINFGQLQEEELAQLHFVDRFGLKPKLRHAIRLNAREDEPPQVDFREVPPESSILLLETITLRISSNDDFGLSSTKLRMKAIRGGEVIIDTTLYDQPEANSSVLQSGFTFPFDPRFFTLQDGDVAEFTALASDRMPDREPVQSRTVRFFIVGPEKHAEIIRDRMEAIMSRTSEIAREQESLLMETIELQEEVEASEESIDSKTERKLSKLADMQRANSRDLKANAEEGMEVLEEAARNPLFDQDALKDFGETLEKMESVASNQLGPASSKMQEAQSSPPSAASESLAEAEQLEREALDQLQEILSDSSEQLDRLEALTLAQRLRKVEKTENLLSRNVLTLLPKSIGERAEQLAESIFSEKERIEAVQLETHLEAIEVKKEISRFHERTGKPAYGEVSELMEEEKAEDGLFEVSRKIDRNVGFEALDELELWEANFKKWADMLEEANSEESGSGQGQGQGEGKDITEQIMALLRIRDSQGDIIQKTKVVNSGNFLAQREKWTETLADQQQELMLDLTDVQIELAEESLNPLFDDAHTAMYGSSAGLENGDSGDETVSAQTESKEIVTDLINILLESAGSQQQSGQGQSMTGMQLLMQQMGQQPGQSQAAGMTPGESGQGSTQGGTTDKAPGDLTGNNLDLEGDRRNSKRTGGASQSPPPEFKKVMENYFRSIEE